MTSATHSAAKRNCQISTDGLSGSEGRVWGDVVGRTSGPFFVLVGGVVLGKAAVDVGEGEGRRTTGVEALREMRMGKCVEAKCVPAKRLRRKDPKREYDGVGPFFGIDPNERYLCLGTGDERCQGRGGD